MARPVLLLTGRHRPHEQLLLAYSTVLGVGYIVGRAAPASVVAMLPGGTLNVWALVLAVSGVIGLIGCWWPGERGSGLEIGGLLMNTGALLIYVTAAFTAATGARGALTAGIIAAWAAANLWRAWQAFRDLRAIRGDQ